MGEDQKLERVRNFEELKYGQDSCHRDAPKGVMSGAGKGAHIRPSKPS